MGKCRIYITFDYELFFGPASGSVAACMLEPTRRLMALGQHQDVRFTFFVDAGMLCALRTRMERYPELAEAYQAVTSQLGELAREGHSIQLHIHPHWEDARYSAGQWQFDLSRYRLHMFSPEEADGLIRRYHTELQQHCESAITAFRAGGWCVQPFEVFRRTFLELGIRVDSTLYEGGYMWSATHQFDFRGMPQASCWSFSHDPMMADEKGEFIEVPISSIRYSRLFCVGMAMSRLLRLKKYRVLGDGQAIGRGLSGALGLVSRGEQGGVCLDGFRCRRVESALQKFAHTEPDGRFVVYSHPKALSEGSFEVLNRLAKYHAASFTVF